MTNKKGDKTGDKGKQKGKGGHNDQQEGKQKGKHKGTSRTEGGNAAPQQGGHFLKALRTPDSYLFGE